MKEEPELGRRAIIHTFLHKKRRNQNFSFKRVENATAAKM